MEAICKVLQKLLKEPERATFPRAFGQIRICLYACSLLFLTRFCCFVVPLGQKPKVGKRHGITHGLTDTSSVLTGARGSHSSSRKTPWAQRILIWHFSWIWAATESSYILQILKEEKRVQCLRTEVWSECGLWQNESSNTPFTLWISIL